MPNYDVDDALSAAPSQHPHPDTARLALEEANQRIAKLEAEREADANALEEARMQWAHYEAECARLREELEAISMVSCGELQVAEDDSAALGWIYERCQKSISSTPAQQPHPDTVRLNSASLKQIRTALQWAKGWVPEPWEVSEERYRERLREGIDLIRTAIDALPGEVENHA